MVHTPPQRTPDERETEVSAPAPAPAVAPAAPPARVLALQATAGNRAVAGLLARRERAFEHLDRRVGAAVGAERTPDPKLAKFVSDTVDELDDDQRKKVLLANVLAVAKLGELPAYAAALKKTPHKTFGDYFIFLVAELEEDFGSRSTIGVLQLFADAGVDLPKQLDTYSLQPLATVAQFKSFLRQIKQIVASGELSKADELELRGLIAEADDALRGIEGPRRRPGPNVKLAGGAAGAATAAWMTAGALAADDVTVIGVADDIAIPFVIVAAVVLSGIAAFSGPKPEILDYAPAKAAVGAALRKMTDLVAISKAMQINGPRATGQLVNVARHLARLLTLAAVGGVGSGEPPRKNDRDDKHWWTEIKASLKNFFQATKGASRKQVLRELLKEFSEAQIAEIEAQLLRAEEMMAETLGQRLLPPP